MKEKRRSLAQAWSGSERQDPVSSCPCTSAPSASAMFGRPVYEEVNCVPSVVLCALPLGCGAVKLGGMRESQEALFIVHYKEFHLTTGL